jgi:hypothetical protein
MLPTWDTSAVIDDPMAKLWWHCGVWQCKLAPKIVGVFGGSNVDAKLLLLARRLRARADGVLAEAQTIQNPNAKRKMLPRSVLGLDQGPQSRQCRGAAGTQREVEREIVIV